MVEVKHYRESLDAQLSRLGAHIETEREKPSSELLTTRELVKKSLRTYSEQLAPLQNVSVANATASSQPVSQATPAPDAFSGSLPNYFLDSDIADTIKVEVTTLVAHAVSEGLERAIKESRAHSAFVQDAFHDALVDKLMPELKKRGIVK